MTVRGGVDAQQYVAMFTILLIDAFAVLLLLTKCLLRLYKRKLQARQSIVKADHIVAFFHPYCNAGGGGERVLWTAIACLQREEPKTLSIVYTGDVSVSKEDILSKVKARFAILLDSERIQFVMLKKRWLVEEATWPRFTLLGQSLGSIVLTYEALSQTVPDIFIDTMGYAFSYPLVRLLTQSPIISYTHYPTISIDMIDRVRNRQAGHSNPASVASSVLRSNTKLLYYTLFARIYAYCLAQPHCLLVNSKWTCSRINNLLASVALKASILYPPCDVSSLATLPLERRGNIILSIAQFRPEKEHEVQIRSIKALNQKYPDIKNSAKLVLAGSVRNEADENRVDALKKLAADLGVSDQIQFVVNAPYSDLLHWFGTASVGLSTMVDEHFGIGVVEIMAAGIIPIVHPSAGPLLDIVVPFEGQPTGFHASSPEEFAEKILLVLSLDRHQQLEFRQRARLSVQQRFSSQIFDQCFLDQYRSIAYRTA